MAGTIWNLCEKSRVEVSIKLAAIILTVLCGVVRTLVLPAWTPQAVQNMPAQPMSIGNPRVIEIIGWRPLHAKSLHDSPGALVGDHRDTKDFLQSQALETIREYEPRPLGRIAMSPIGGVETPADLDRWGEVRFVTDTGQSNETDKRTDSRYLDRPEDESLPRDM